MPRTYIGRIGIIQYALDVRKRQLTRYEEIQRRKGEGIPVQFSEAGRTPRDQKIELSRLEGFITDLDQIELEINEALNSDFLEEEGCFPYRNPNEVIRTVIDNHLKRHGIVLPK